MFVMMCSYSLIGLLQSFVNRTDTADEDNPMMAMMGAMPGAGMPGGGPDPSKAFKAEQDSDVTGGTRFR